MDDFKRKLAEDLGRILGIPPAEMGGLIEMPGKPEWGDYAVPCFHLARTLRQDPRQIADRLATHLKATGHYERLTPVNAYLNVALKREEVVRTVISAIRNQPGNYGDSDRGRGKTVVIEFSSPNTTKPFHMGHLRTTVLGNSLACLHQALGYKVIRLNYLGDWGTQFGKLITAFKRWGDPDAIRQDPINKLTELYIRYSTELEDDPQAQEEAREWFRKLESGDGEARRLWQWFNEESMGELHRLYGRLHISFDEFSGESRYAGQVERLLEGLGQKQITSISQGAVVVDLEKEQLGVAILKKADGTTIYAARDICAAQERYDTYRFNRMIYVTDMGQSLHFKQVFKILEMMGRSFSAHCIHVPYGLVMLKEGKMSTRQGNVVYLDEVLTKAVDLVQSIIREKNPELKNQATVAESVGVSAVIFADLASKTRKDIVFDWDEVLNFNGETGPYVQYTHARLCSILRKYGQQLPQPIDFSLLLDDMAYNLVKQLMLLPDRVRKACETYEPSLVASYAVDVCTAANGFYNHCRVLSDNQEETKARVALVHCTQMVIHKCLLLLGMSVPEEM